MSDDEAERTEVSEFIATLRQESFRQESENNDVAALWESLDGAQRKRIVLAEYRCKRGCLLLSAFRLPGGRFFYKPRHILSPARAQSDTVPAARAKWTTDGYRDWGAQAGSLDRLIRFCSPAADQGGLRLDCRHVRGSLVTAARLDADTSGTPGPKPTILWE